MAHRGLILYSYTEDGIELCDASFIRTDCYCPEIKAYTPSRGVSCKENTPQAGYMLSARCF